MEGEDEIGKEGLVQVGKGPAGKGRDEMGWWRESERDGGGEKDGRGAWTTGKQGKEERSKQRHTLLVWGRDPSLSQDTAYKRKARCCGRSTVLVLYAYILHPPIDRSTLLSAGTGGWQLLLVVASPSTEEETQFDQILHKYYTQTRRPHRLLRRPCRFIAWGQGGRGGR